MESDSPRTEAEEARWVGQALREAGQHTPAEQASRWMQAVPEMVHV